MQPVVTIDLQKDPEVAALVADMEPGDRVYAAFTIKFKDDQSLYLRLSDMAETRDELPGGTDDEEDETSSDDEGAEGEGSDSNPQAKEKKSPGEAMMSAMGRGSGKGMDMMT